MAHQSTGFVLCSGRVQLHGPHFGGAWLLRGQRPVLLGEVVVVTGGILQGQQ